MLKNLTIENFRSYAKASLSFGTGKLNVVIGDSQSDYSDSNGSGKSTLMYAVCWVLFGQWPGMDKADSAVRQPYGKDCLVEATFAVHGRDYVVRRTRSHSKHGSAIFIDGNTGDMPVMQQRVEQLVGMNYDTFAATMIFTGHPDAAFSDMTDSEQKKILRALLPVDLGDATERSLATLREVDNKLQNAQMQLQTWQTTLAQRKQRYAAQQSAIENQKAREQESVIRCTQTIDDGKLRIERLLERGVTLREELTTSRNRLAEMDKLAPSWMETSKQWQALLDKAHQHERLHGELMSAKRYQAEQIGRIDRSIEAILRQIEETRSMQIEGTRSKQAKICPACGSVVSDLKHLEGHYQKQYDALAKEREEMLVKEAQKANEISVKLAQFQMAPDYAAKSAEFRQQYEQFNRDYSATKDSVNRILNEIANNERDVKSCEAAIAQSQTKLAEIRSGTSAAEAVLAEIQKDIEAATQTIVDGQRTVDEAHVEKRLADSVALLFSSGKGSLRHFIFESALPELSATAQMFLRFLSDEQLNVSLKSHRESGKKVVEGFFVEATKAGCTGSYGDLSGGEKRRIDLSIFLALNLIANRNVFPLKTLFLDEIADPLDETGQQKVVQLLHHICAEYSINCLLLTNVKELVASSPSGYRCTMRNSVSELLPFNES